jgi:hypothetical protein
LQLKIAFNGTFYGLDCSIIICNRFLSLLGAHDVSFITNL